MTGSNLLKPDAPGNVWWLEMELPIRFRQLNDGKLGT